MTFLKSCPLALAASVAFGLLTSASHAAIVNWTFDNVAGASTPTVTSAPPSSGSIPNITVGSMSGVGDDPATQTGVFSNAVSNVPGSSAGNNYGMYVAPTTTGTTAPGATGYLEVTLTPDAGYTVSLADLDFNSRATSTGSRNYSIRWSVDGFASDIFAGAIDNAGSTWKAYDSGFTAVTDPVSEPVTVRLYVYGGVGNPGSSANVRFDDIKLDASAVLVPEPASITLAALAGLPLISRRRR